MYRLLSFTDFFRLLISFIGLSNKRTFLAGKISQFTRPRLPGRLQIPSAQILPKAPPPTPVQRLLHRPLSSEASAAQEMESTFWSLQVKQAWDSVPVVQDAQSPLLPSFSEEHGPWPLPFYPVLGLFPSDSCDYQEQLLPGWIGDFAGIHPRTDSCGIQSTSEHSIPDSVNTFQEEQPENQETPGTRENAVEDLLTVVMQPGSCSRAPHCGNEALDTNTCGGSISSECQRMASTDWGSKLRTLSGFLERIPCLLSCLLCGCCPRAFCSREP